MKLKQVIKLLVFKFIESKQVATLPASFALYDFAKNQGKRISIFLSLLLAGLIMTVMGLYQLLFCLFSQPEAFQVWAIHLALGLIGVLFIMVSVRNLADSIIEYKDDKIESVKTKNIFAPIFHQLKKEQQNFRIEHNTHIH